MQTSSKYDILQAYINFFVDNSDVFFEKITSIKILDKQQVYDLDIENTDNFIANDIIAHNTAADEDGFVNTSGLVLLMHLNNESDFGENATGNDADTVYDFSVEVNSERSGSTPNNGTTKDGATINKISYKLGSGAGEFDGVDNLINVQSDTSIDDLGPLTITAWINPTTFGEASKGYIFRKGSLIFFLQEDSGAEVETFELFKDGSTDLILIAGNNVISLGEWQFVAVTWDGGTSASGVNLYRNGFDVTDGFTQNGASLVSDESDNGVIGNDATGVRTFDGQIDELAIWNRSLSAKEIENLYKRGALRLNLSVRSCDDGSCSGEAWSEVLTNNSGIKLNETITPRNRYFQYKAIFNTENVNYTPVLYNITINYTTLATDYLGSYNFTFNAPADAGTYTIKVNTTFDETIDGEASINLTVNPGQTVDLTEHGGFIIQDSTGANLLVIDSMGKLNIKGTLTQDAEPTADDNDFVIQNSTGGLNLVVTNPKGNLLIKNSLTQNQGDLSPTLNSFVIENRSGQVAAYVNSTGGMFITEGITENVVFD